MMTLSSRMISGPQQDYIIINPGQSNDTSLYQQALLFHINVVVDRVYRRVINLGK